MGRQTQQKDAIESVIEKARAPLLPQEIAQRARRLVPRLGMATVYRSLKRLQAEEKVSLVELPGQSPRYEAANLGHHHHFICRQCGKVYDLMACAGDLRKMLPEGFEIESHEITLFGRCRECRG